MATTFAYVPSTCDGRTVEAREPQPIDVVADPDHDPWAWLRELQFDPKEPTHEELASLGA